MGNYSKRTILNLDYDTEDSDEDPDWTPEMEGYEAELLDEDFTSSSTEEDVEEYEDFEETFERILETKDREIKELKQIVTDLSTIIQQKSIDYHPPKTDESSNKTNTPCKV